MRTLLFVLSLAVGLLGFNPAVPMAHCLPQGQGAAHAHPAAGAAGGGFAVAPASHSHDGVAVAGQEPGDDDHHGKRPAAEGCCHAAPTLIGGAAVEPAPSVAASPARPAPRDARGDGRRSFDIFRPPATA